MKQKKDPKKIDLEWLREILGGTQAEEGPTEGTVIPPGKTTSFYHS